MTHILEQYSELYSRLKTVGLDSIIENRNFDKHGLTALKLIAQLPHPSEVSLQQIWDICEECSHGGLKLVFPIDRIGDLARDMLRQMRQTDEHLAEPIAWPTGSYDPESVTDMLQWNNKMMLSFSLHFNRLLRQTDINLKGRCPSCNGDLVEVILLNTTRRKHELRIRCKQQLKQECRNSDWFMQDVEKRNP